ncbi:MAG: hypothetical protein K9N35_10225 [Candidatus Marinimicrobia bacterium]|nr:hypothetical protein [Candidatus Neomarinimicrobiota bacterium]
MFKNPKTLIIPLLIILGVSANAQLTISPTSLFIDSQRKFETLLIMNSSNIAQEVKLSWEFGYPKTDEAGNISIVYHDEEQAKLHSAADWIRGFPRNFILEPGARQTIRITVKAPRNLEPGTYWSRLKTTSSAVSPPIGGEAGGNISAQINFQFNQVTSIFYKNGQLNTGLEITGLRNSIEDQLVRIFAEYKKTGNSPFLGTMAVKVFDGSGQILKNDKIFVSIYFDGLRRLDLDISDLPKGSYEYEVSFLSGRGDIPDINIVPAPTVSTRGSFTKI